MKKTYIAAAVICSILLLVDTVVLVTPVYAKVCTVDCGGCPSITCTGDTCQIIEGQGCVAMVGGDVAESKTCCGG